MLIFVIYPILCYNFFVLMYILPCKDDLLKAVAEAATEGGGKRG